MKVTKQQAEGARDERAAIRRLIRSYIRRTNDALRQVAANEILGLIREHVLASSKRPGGYGRR